MVPFVIAVFTLLVFHQPVDIAVRGHPTLTPHFPIGKARFLPLAGEVGFVDYHGSRKHIGDVFFGYTHVSQNPEHPQIKKSDLPGNDPGWQASQESVQQFLPLSTLQLEWEFYKDPFIAASIVTRLPSPE